METTIAESERYPTSARMNPTDADLLPRCGHLYCDVHASYQMKLSPSALSDPINGIWCRVCEKCYMERDGYRDSIGVSRNKTQAFIRLRKNRINNLHLEANKLEKRLEKV